MKGILTFYPNFQKTIEQWENIVYEGVVCGRWGMTQMLQFCEKDIIYWAKHLTTHGMTMTELGNTVTAATYVTYVHGTELANERQVWRSKASGLGTEGYWDDQGPLLAKRGRDRPWYKEWSNENHTFYTPRRTKDQWKTTNCYTFYNVLFFFFCTADNWNRWYGVLLSGNTVFQASNHLKLITRYPEVFNRINNIIYFCFENGTIFNFKWCQYFVCVH